MNRNGSSDESQPRFKKKVATQEEPRGTKVKIEKGGGSQVVKSTCSTCEKRHYMECLLGTGSYFGSSKDKHRVRDCPTRYGKQVAPNVRKDGAPKKRHFCALRTRGENPDEGDDDDGKIFLMSTF